MNINTFPSHGQISRPSGPRGIPLSIPRASWAASLVTRDHVQAQVGNKNVSRAVSVVSGRGERKNGARKGRGSEERRRGRGGRATGPSPVGAGWAVLQASPAWEVPPALHKGGPGAQEQRKVSF